VFVNVHPLRLNARFLAHRLACRRAFREPLPSAAATRAAAAAYRRDGFVLLPPSDPQLVQQLAKRCRDLVEMGQVVITKGLEEWMVRVADAIRHAPEIAELIHRPLADVLTLIYRSHFKIHQVTMYRLEPTPEPMQVSGLWHLDNYPPGMINVMIYLTDADRETGALRVHPRPASRRLVHTGFYDRYRAERYVPRLERRWVPLEGPAGTAIIFDPTLVHRTTPPLRGYRDVVLITFLPAREPWHRHYARVGEGVSVERRGRMVPDDPRAD